MTSLDQDGFPEAFADLKGFLEKWALPTNAERYSVRSTCSMEELRAFYDAMVPRLEDLLAWLDRKPIDELEGADLQLLQLCLALSEVGLAIEVYNAPVLRLAPRLDEFVVRSAGMTVG